MAKRFSFFMIGLVFFLFTLPSTIFASENSNFSIKISDPIPVKQSNPLVTISGKASNGNNETPGEWYIGGTPPNLIPNAPILLFVPGLNNVAQVFWEDNDMYQTAYNAGYQTTFIQLYDAGGASADMWNNGQLLAAKIREISNYFGGKPITVIAYSKGGVDTQTALTYYGAWQYVDNVITLSSPHHGSQLADLAYSSSAGWLASLLGATGDGTYSMQMGYMSDYRSQTDSQPRAYYNDYYTLGGTSWGSAFSSTWYGGVYLSQYGSNDGVVTTASSQLPQGQVLAIGNWNHTTIRTGITFPVFQNYITDNTYFRFRVHESSMQKTSPSYNQWVNGGPLQADKVTTIPVTVEDGVQELTLNLMTTTELGKIKLVSPTGEEVIPDIHVNKLEEGVFQGAIQNTITLKTPSDGNWNLYLEANQKDAYLLVATFKDVASKIIQTEKTKSNKASLNYQLHVDLNAVREGSLKATYNVTQSNNPANSKTFTAKGKKMLSQILTFSNNHEVYNITIEIEGMTKKGKPFKRTIIDSVYVD
jgi:hypothetical protein